jgi:uncharacterized membrane protein
VVSVVSSRLAARQDRPGRLGWYAVVALASLVSLASSRYLAGGALMIPPPLKSNFMDHPVVFYVHIGAASTALLVGPWQFLEGLRRKHTAVHRTIGAVYVAACLVGGVAALPIAFGSNGGPIGAAGFLTLAVLWLWTTTRAAIAIVSGDGPAHGRWMMRSFALTLAGVTLRLYLPVALIAPFGFHDAYAAIAWLCWAPNLLLADHLTRVKTKRRSTK